ncbi:MULTISPECIES: hypothetical protein [unclassified Microcoleus]|uniref:hypothetical protein n=1 Tax=unclassified Microcoleus TaxID=2642155 RepID=UPI002FD237EE
MLGDGRRCRFPPHVGSPGLLARFLVKVFPSLQNSGHKAMAIQLALLPKGGWESNEAVGVLQSF